MRIEKQYAMKADGLKDNCLRGKANVAGIMDRTGDVVFPGFWGDALPGFLRAGFMPLSHQWEDLPIAYPVAAEERGNILDTTFVFHSTQAAQEARTVAMERHQAGLDVGLSVGFSIKPDGYAYFDNGKQLLEHAKKLRCDMSLFSQRQISAHTGYCRALLPGGCQTLHEVSLVSVPANQQSHATSVKGEAYSYLDSPAEQRARQSRIQEATRRFERVRAQAEVWEIEDRARELRQAKMQHKLDEIRLRLDANSNTRTYRQALTAHKFEGLNIWLEEEQAVRNSRVRAAERRLERIKITLGA